MILIFFIAALGMQEPEQTTRSGVEEVGQLVFSDDFEQPSGRWELTDQKAWRHLKLEDGNSVFGLNRRKSDYQPPVRSPHNVALIKDLSLDNFVMTLDVKSTKDTGNHRDCCLFFGYQNPQQFYYVHLGAKPDPHSGQIMIVNKKPRIALTKNERLVPWDDRWHQLKLVRNADSGVIQIYFDDFSQPLMEVNDKTFGKGRIGIGSFDDMNDFDNVKIFK